MCRRKANSPRLSRWPVLKSYFPCRTRYSVLAGTSFASSADFHARLRAQHGRVITIVTQMSGPKTFITNILTSRKDHSCRSERNMLNVHVPTNAFGYHVAIMWLSCACIVYKWSYMICIDWHLKNKNTVGEIMWCDIKAVISKQLWLLILYTTIGVFKQQLPVPESRWRS